MDALLQYALYKIAFSLLYYELVLMLIGCLAIIITKVISRRITAKRVKAEQAFSTEIEENILNDKPLSNLSKYSFRNLVETLEKFDHLFIDDKWLKIKDHVITHHLLPQLPKYASSWSWFKRQLAARAYLLDPSKADEKILGKLMDDKKYLVRIPAAVCITKTTYKNLFYSMIKMMSRENVLSRFPYRDALIQSPEDHFEWLSALLKVEGDKKIVAICLDVLSTRYTDNLLPLVKPHINDSDRDCRILAIKALGNIPSDEVTHLLIDHLNDSDWEIRAEAVQSLQKLHARESIPKLIELLNDPIWWVRLQSALTLKLFGKDGIEALSQQQKIEKPLAYEIAQYTLALP